MSLLYIIDGYNILNHPALTKLSSSKSADPRLTLLNLIKENKLTGSSKNKITLVFDGYPHVSYAGSLSANAGEAEVIFSREESADEKIKKIVESFANRKNIIVVSDDKEIQLAARFLKAKTLGVEDFIGSPAKAGKDRAEEADPKINYTQMQRINEELRKLWLR